MTIHKSLISNILKPVSRAGCAAAIAFSIISGSCAFAADSVTMKLDDGAQPQGQSEPIKPEIQVPANRSGMTGGPIITAASAVLMDSETGQVLYSKNAHTKRPIASTTKIMTAVLMIENCGMSDVITASKNASQTMYTSLHLMPGEKILARDLLTGMLIRSANDAAVAAAEHISGTVPKFAALMNKKAAEIGCTDTHFVTPNGLYDPKHYSSAYDLCLIARYAIRYPLFNEIVNTRKYTLSSRTMNRKDLVVYSKCRYLKNYPGADGIKSGYIKQARYCYVGSATRDGMRLVSSVLRSNNSGNDTAALMDYGFANYQAVPVAQAATSRVDVKVDGGDKKEIAALPVHDLHVVVPKTGACVTTKVEVKPVKAPVLKDSKVGTVYAMVNGTMVASVDLKATDSVGVSFARRAWGLVKMGGLLAACLIVGGRVGTAFTKGTRRRRRRFTSSLRNPNIFR